jgi:hypothetical protein
MPYVKDGTEYTLGQIKAQYPHISFAPGTPAELGFTWVNPPAPEPIDPRLLMVVTPRQIRQALNQTGDRASVDAAVAEGTQDLKDWWEFATSFERLHPEVIAMGTGLGKTDADLDGLFTLAASL